MHGQIEQGIVSFQRAVIIHDIYDGCAAQRDGRLLVGDQILEVVFVPHCEHRSECLSH